MAVKTITVTEDAYNRLKRMKHGDESFSDVIKRIGSEKKPIADFFGLLKHSESSTEEMQERIRETREKTSKDIKNRYERLRQLSSN